MSKILDLAKTFKETSNKEAESISKALQSDLRQLESDIATALKLSNQTLKSAINESQKELSKEIMRNQRRMSLSLFKTWIWLLGFLLLLVLGLMIWSLWQGVTIYDQSQSISVGKAILKELPEGLEMEKVGQDTYLIQNAKMKKPELYQNQDNQWIIKVSK